ncbi:MAG TPA: hypothetical protein VN519_12835 [Bryobacteraceae bacterium]|nr:hypothetical protein [Bryobacteraceae bacterium]
MKLLALLFLFVCLVMAGGKVTSPDAAGRYPAAVDSPEEQVETQIPHILNQPDVTIAVTDFAGRTLREAVSAASARLPRDRYRTLAE